MSTTLTDPPAPSPGPLSADRRGPDHRGSWVPNGAMIATRFMELRKRRGLMVTLILVTIGFPTIFLLIRPVSESIFKINPKIFHRLALQFLADPPVNRMCKPRGAIFLSRPIRLCFYKFRKRIDGVARFGESLGAR